MALSVNTFEDLSSIDVVTDTGHGVVSGYKSGWLADSVLGAT